MLTWAPLCPLQGLKEFSNWPTFPQLYVGGELIGGCDIVLEMHKTGSIKTPPFPLRDLFSIRISTMQPVCVAMRVWMLNTHAQWRRVCLVL